MLTILNDSDMESDSDSELDSSIENNESDDRAEAHADRSTGSDNDSDATKFVDVDSMTLQFRQNNIYSHNCKTDQQHKCNISQLQCAIVYRRAQHSTAAAATTATKNSHHGMPCLCS